MEAKDITNRIWACCELINIGSYSSMKKLEEAIMQESDFFFHYFFHFIIIFFF
mgnify:CR=1 FL=1